MKVTSKANLNFCASHFRDQDPWDAIHDFDLYKYEKPEVYLSLDYMQQGLGNASCGPGTLPQYQIKGNATYTYSFRITNANADGNTSSQSLKKTSDKPSLKIFPNPTTNKSLSIQLSGFETEKYVLVTMTDFNGKEVYQSTLQNTTTMNLTLKSGLINGLYLITVRGKNSEITGKVTICS